MDTKIKKDRDWSEYPIGTKAWAIMGGYWEKVIGPPSGWKWCTGDTFPTPGADTTGYVTLPDLHESEVRRVAEDMAKAQYEKNYRQLASCFNFDLFENNVLDWTSPFVKKAISSLSETLTPCARVAISEMAKRVKLALLDNIDSDGSWDRDDFINKYMAERGLIPNNDADEGEWVPTYNDPDSGGY
jgi:hypothetical protein